MEKPRIFLGSSGKQAKLLQALTRGLEDDRARRAVDDGLQSGNHHVGAPAGTHARGRLRRFRIRPRRLDQCSKRAASNALESAQASPRDNVVFEAGLFGGVLGMRRTFILHASGAKLPSDLLGLTCVRYDATTTAAAIKAINQKLRSAIENELRAPAN